MPPAHPAASEACGALREAPAFIFDVEGTLVDAVMPTLLCWRATLQEFGQSVSLADLHRYCGMDGGEMLEKLLPAPVPPQHKKELLDRQGKRYREEYLPSVQALPGVRNLFEAIKAYGCRIGLATDCQKDELDYYLERTNVRDLIDAIACGNDVKRGKPHPDLFELARKRLKLRMRSSIVCIGDTPYDALAARSAGMTVVGVLTGHFASADLLASGCLTTFLNPRALMQDLTRCRDTDVELAAAS
jgi:HAD superfamily hydrolase (TIGR01509 family)